MLEISGPHGDPPGLPPCGGRSVVQFAYGEDGVDVLATPFLTRFGFLAANAGRFAQRLDLPAALAASRTAGLEATEARAAKLSRCARAGAMTS